MVPFLAHGRRFYIGLGTIASDLIILLVVTGIARGRFAARWPWAWRMIHATAYLCWPLAIVHGLLGGRAAKPYVDWSYGACLALVALALGIRHVATIRAKNDLVANPVPDHVSAPMAALAAESFASQRTALGSMRTAIGGQRTPIAGRRAAIASERINDVHQVRPDRALPRAQRALPAGPSSRPAESGRPEAPRRTIAMSLHDEPDHHEVVAGPPGDAERPTAPNRRPPAERPTGQNRRPPPERPTAPNRRPPANRPAAPYPDGPHTGPLPGAVPYAGQPQLDTSHPSGPHAMPAYTGGPADGPYQDGPYQDGPYPGQAGGQPPHAGAAYAEPDYPGTPYPA
ncbi:MAG TPA: hypothetical protein VGJ50_13625, partial [Streptosporangiaceae bacterium]